ncbi:hypothetical protein VZC37_12865 [Gordonia sp. LSe1-13]|uniref:Secreted protein n=1 Tax=Gordonia sesuvii TaxID=3116777 RepID=A0ABU7MEI8_9ACTN|nr:hypothetical protein [Gordonia sp. LSe1-13]
MERYVRRLVVVAAFFVASLLGATACGQNTERSDGLDASGSSSSELLEASDFGEGYELHPGSSAGELAEQQRHSVATREYTPAVCEQVFAQQADRTEASQRRGIYVEHERPYKPSFGDFVTRGGESLEQTREVYRQCGSFTAVVAGEGEISMTTTERPVPPGIDTESLVIETVVTTEPYPDNPNSVPAQQKSLIGHAQLGDKRVTFYEEIFGFDSALDTGRFDELFVRAVERASTAD